MEDISGKIYYFLSDKNEFALKERIYREGDITCNKVW